MSGISQPPRNEAESKSNDRFAALKSGIDPKHIKQREGWRDRQGNAHLVDYVEWHTVADILDEHAPDWSHTVVNMAEIGDIFTVTAAVTVDGITRMGIGTGAAGSELGIKKAEHDALKRAALKFGVGRELYKKESDLIERRGAATENFSPASVPSDPIAKSPSDLITAKQIGMILALGREKNIDPEAECRELWSGLTLEIKELSKKSASVLIEHLQDASNVPNEPAIVETGIPDAPKESRNVREMPARQVAPSTPAREDSARQMRGEIVALFNEVGQNSDPSCAAFDRETDLSKKRDVFNGIKNYVVQIKREQIKRMFEESDWNQKQIGEELARFGITEGLSRASGEQVNRMWADFKGRG